MPLLTKRRGVKQEPGKRKKGAGGLLAKGKRKRRFRYDTMIKNGISATTTFTALAHFSYFLFFYFGGKVEEGKTERKKCGKTFSSLLLTYLSVYIAS